MEEVKSAKSLLEVREQQLKSVDNEGLRSLGKYWGMDVFTWSNPFSGVLANMIHSFPFPVLWVGNHADIAKTLLADEDVCYNIDGLIMTDASIFSLPDVVLSNVKNCASSNNLSETIELLNAFKSNQKILLFTSSGEEGTMRRKEFETYLNNIRSLH
ncbi:MAG: hypothetical protein V4638_10050 [Bacteroidota bacterium]